MSSPPVIAEIAEVSAGIEVEGLFIFTEKVLGQVLSSERRLDKQALTEYGTRMSHQACPGWAIHDKPQAGKRPDFRYRDEPQRMVEFLLGTHSKNASNTGSTSQQHGMGNNANNNQQRTTVNANMINTTITDNSVDIPAAQEPARPPQTPSGWSIHRDISVTALNSTQKAARGLHPDVWDTIDIEFASRKFICDAAGSWVEQLRQEFKDIVGGLNTEDSAIMEAEGAGLHVHVGMSDDSRFPIKAVRIIAFILLVYEREITKIHEVHRAPGLNSRAYNSHLQSNIAEWRVERRGDALTFEPDRITMQMDGGSVKHKRSKYAGISTLRHEILDGENDTEDAHKAFKAVMSKGHKRWAHNFYNIDGENVVHDRPQPVSRPPTIEFRLAAGTMDPVLASHWPVFCVAIVRLGLELAATDAPVLPTIQSWSDEIDIEDLIEMLQLPDDTRECLESRLEVREDEMAKQYLQEQKMKVHDVWEGCDENGNRESDFDDALRSSQDGDEEESRDVDYDEDVLSEQAYGGLEMCPDNQGTGIGSDEERAPGEQSFGSEAMDISE